MLFLLIHLRAKNKPLHFLHMSGRRQRQNKAIFAALFPSVPAGKSARSSASVPCQVRYVSIGRSSGSGHPFAVFPCGPTVTCGKGDLAVTAAVPRRIFTCFPILPGSICPEAPNDALFFYCIKKILPCLSPITFPNKPPQGICVAVFIQC